MPHIVFLWLTLISCQENEDVPLSVSPMVDLSPWKLTLPVDENNDGKADEFVDLSNYQNNQRIKPYMFDNPDGSLAFYCSYTGVSTPNSKYSRTELREQVVSGDNSINWTFDTGGVMKGHLEIEEISDGHRTIVMQIHGRLTEEQRVVIGEDDHDAPPLLKIYFQNNKIRVKRKVLVDTEISDQNLLLKSSWQDDEGHYFDRVVNNQSFHLEVRASKGALEIVLDGESIVYNDDSMQRWPFENYFKAGNYLQSNVQGAFAKVNFHQLEVTH